MSASAAPAPGVGPAPMSAQPIRREVLALLKLAGPIALAQAGQAAMGLVDTAVVGRVSAAAQGAVGLGNGVTFSLSVLGMGVMMAFDPLISQAIGAGQPARARTLYWQSVWMALGLSAALSVPLVLAPLLLEPVGVGHALAEGAATFVWWRMPALPGLLLFIGAKAYLQGVGRPAALLWAMLLANLANLGLDVVLVFGLGPVPPLGIAGAAIATSLCTWLQLGLLLLFLGPSPEGSTRRLDARQLRAALAVGAPIGAQLGAETGVFALAGVLAGTLGESAVAAHQVALNWASLSFCFAVGVGSAGAVRVGWAIGAGSVPAARRAGLVAFGLGTSVMAASALLFWVVPFPLARMMTDKPPVVAAAVALFGVTAVFQISDGIQAVGSGVLRGAADTRFAFFANLVGHWAIGMPVAVWLGLVQGLGVTGLWWGLSVGLTAVAIALLGRFLRLTRAASTAQPAPVVSAGAP